MITDAEKRKRSELMDFVGTYLAERHVGGGLYPTMDEENRQVWGTNKTRKTKPKQGLYWCDGCDANLVGPSEKCDVCGYADGSKRFKKKG